ncbi:peptide chain release factor A [Bacillus cereus]|nr:peptide chain release factor A [Bacillus cereus]
MFVSRKQKQIEQYFRCLSTICIDSYFLVHYFTKYEFTFIRDRILGKRFLKRQLREFDCNDSAQLKEKIEWLLEEGTRQEFHTIHNQLTPLSEAGQKLSLTSQSSNEKIYIVNYSLHMLPDAGIAAFDYAQCIYLSRIGNRLGYLSKKEAEHYMIQAAKLAQKSYSDWKEYFLAYHIGCHFNKSDIKFTNVDKYNFTYPQSMFRVRDSYLNTIAWENDLLTDLNEG